MTCLVTGATGFVGSAVARALLERGEAVRVLARPESDRRNIEGLAVEVVEGDLRDKASLERACHGCQALFHVAADYRLWVPEPDEIYAANVDGTRALMEAAGEAGVTRIVYTSSVATLGLNRDASPADEATAVSLADMIGHYKRSKFLAEAAVRRLVAEAGLPAVIVTPSMPVGPRDIRPTPTGRIIVEAARGRMPAFVDTGLNVVHVADVADAILFMLSTSLSKDLYKRFVRPNASDAQVLYVARAAALAGGAMGVLLALVLPSVIGALSIFYALMAVCLFVPIVAGLYSRLPGVPEALAASGM